ncbi:sialidase family protein [Luteolibacter sp. LG18]|uniref:sialidase family protein n=1 Tax=Luteolibacter sp. LG18 TaxID=2819286 RepID=UPI002B308DFE|nr:sialidase [Luteolibacter sp. LG18]
MRALVFITILSCHLAAATPPVDLFKGSGHAPDHTYRIPSLAVTRKGTLLAFAELRKNSAGDTGDIDTVVKRSTDGGKTWSAETVALDLDGNTIGNACPVVDPATGRITVVAVWNKVPENQIKAGFGEDSRRVYLAQSDDDGVTWSKPEDISPQVKQPGWGWFASGPGAGIVLARGSHKGRMVIGANHRETEGDAPGYYAHTIYSDDSGKTWQSSRTFAARHTNECEVVELADGKLLLNMRNHGSGQRDRAVALSKDGGETWEETHWDAHLPEPQCMGSILRQSWPGAGTPGLILFSNPASRSGRRDLVLRGSRDDGQTWPLAKLIQPGDAAYSHLAVLPDGAIAIAYETDRYSRIAFTTVRAGELRPAEDVVKPDGTPRDTPAP